MKANANKLPDITSHHHSSAQSLEWVGMEKIGLPIKLILSDRSEISVACEADILVSLDTPAKGIHMSRLYLKLKELLANNPLTLDSLNKLLNTVLASHTGISESARVKLSFEIPIRKKALVSDNFGYQTYPIVLMQTMKSGNSETSLEITVPYSSTCPCSSSLANKLNSESFDNAFSDERVSKQDVINWLTNAETALAIPHAQRSYAYIKLTLSEAQWITIDTLILQVEDAIGTPVQTAVKREDEQAFAKLNGSNLMFCEDAARKLKQFLENQTNIADYWFKVEHQESLHAHNAVVIDRK